MRLWRKALALALGSSLAWAAVVACGSERPPPSETNSVTSPSDDAALDSGVFLPGTPTGPCIDLEASAPVDLAIGIELTFDGAPTECACVYRNRNGTEIKHPCGIALCIRSLDRMYDCMNDGKMRLYQGNGVGTTCDAASVPPNAPPCTAPR